MALIDSDTLKDASEAATTAMGEWVAAADALRDLKADGSDGVDEALARMEALQLEFHRSTATLAALVRTEIKRAECTPLVFH